MTSSRNGGESPLKDPNYNLITVVQQSLQNVWQLEDYINDAETHNDRELADWLRDVQEHNRKGAEQGQRLLSQRLGR